MSDEQAKAKETETEQVKKEQEERNARLWVLSLALDPETGEFMMSPNENITKQYQVTTLMEEAQKAVDSRRLTQIVMSSIGAVLQAGGPAKGKKGIIKP